MDEEIAEFLQRYAPDACWTVHQDPKYEFPGMMHVGVPGLGTYQFACDAEGQPVPGVSAVRAVLDDPAALAELFGLAHLDAVAARRRPDTTIVVEPPPFAAFRRERTGQGWIPLGDNGPLVTFRAAAGPAGHTAAFGQLDEVLFGAGWAAIGPWTRYSRGGVWTNQLCRVDQQPTTPTTPPAVTGPAHALPGEPTGGSGGEAR